MGIDVIRDIKEKNENQVREQFRFNILPMQQNRWIVWLLIFLIPMVGSLVLLPILGSLYFSTSFALTGDTVMIIAMISGFLSIFCILDGIFAGYWWKKTGRWITRYGFLRPLEQMIEQQQKGQEISLLNSLIFGSGENFLLYNAQDVDHSSLLKMAKSNLKAITMLAAMFIVVLNFLLKWSGFTNWITAVSERGAATLINYFQLSSLNFQAPLETFILFYITLSLALILLAIVLPILLITDHTFVYQFTDDRRVVGAGSKPRRTIKDTFSIFTIISGFNLIREDLQLVQNPNLLTDILVFVSLLLVIAIYGVPIVFSAFNSYYKEHKEIVNELRDTLRRAGYPISYSEKIPVPPSMLEKLEIQSVLNHQVSSPAIPRSQLADYSDLLRTCYKTTAEKSEQRTDALISDLEAELDMLGYHNPKVLVDHETGIIATLVSKEEQIYITVTHGTKYTLLENLEKSNRPFSCGKFVSDLDDLSGLKVHKEAKAVTCRQGDPVAEYILQQPHHSSVTIIGHGYAGMIASLLSGYLLKINLPTAIDLINFGSPAVGNKEFVTYLEDNLHYHLLISNHDDPTSNLLPEFLGYAQLTNTLILDEDGSQVPQNEAIIFPTENLKAIQAVISKFNQSTAQLLDEYTSRLELFADSKK